MNFDVGSIADIAKQILGFFLGLAQVNTGTGQGIMKIIDFFAMLGDMLVRGISSIGSFFGGLGG